MFVMKASGDQRKTSSDLVPKFYWKRRNVLPYVPYEELKEPIRGAVVETTEENETGGEQFSSLKEETTGPDEDEKGAQNEDQPKQQIVHHLTAVEKRREEDLIMNRFSNNQKELIRQMGGFPKRTLTVVS